MFSNHRSALSSITVLLLLLWFSIPPLKYYTTWQYLLGNTYRSQFLKFSRGHFKHFCLPIRYLLKVVGAGSRLFTCKNWNNVIVCTTLIKYNYSLKLINTIIYFLQFHVIISIYTVLYNTLIELKRFIFLGSCILGAEFKFLQEIIS